MTYDPANLTTHAFVTGMTGSGKTGACIALLEEAALHGIPAIVIDPKGDLTNLLLHFPDLLPSDFEPWLDPEEARRQGKPLSTLAEETAKTWKEGLAGWDLGREQLLALKELVDFPVFTPGSTAGTPVNVLSSFAAPGLTWAENSEILREKIASTVTALLGLVGMDNIDPLRSREHILLSNILETAWSQGRSLELMDLILQVQNPPFERLGAFPVNNFFPEKDRFDLAMLLNNFLATPSFQTWLQGQSLDVPALLYSPDGKPRHSIFYLAHLSDAERMFFVTLLLSSVETWMRTQRGTGGLRALVYFDEILGYMPPVANPPSHPVLLRLLKQARAFGVGLVLATQNPVDVDYKGLSNMGTWFIGRLQTDRDKQRLLDGLESAQGGLDRAAYDQLISGLKKRVFLLHSIYRPAPQQFSTRWDLNFLAGPLTRAQIPDLVRMQRGASAPAPSTAAQAGPVAAQPAAASAVPVQPPPAAKPAAAKGYPSARQTPPAGITEYFLPDEVATSAAIGTLNIPVGQSMEVEGIVYHPALIAQADVRYLQRRYNLDTEQKVAALVTRFDGVIVHWDEFSAKARDSKSLSTQPLPNAWFAPLPAELSDARGWKGWQADFTDWVYRNGTVQVRANEQLKVYAGPDVTLAQFHEQCRQASDAGLDAELEKLKDKYKSKMSTLQSRVQRQELEVDQQKDEVSQRGREQFGSMAEFGLSLLGGRKRSISSSLSKSRLTSKAKADLKQEQQELEALEKQLKDMQADFDREQAEIQDRWSKTAGAVTEIPITPMKKDIYVELFGVAWLPYYLVKVGDEIKEAPAFQA